MSMTFLFCTDDSEPSRKAEDWARGFLDPGDHRVLVLAVAEPVAENLKSEISAEVDLEAIVRNRTETMVEETVHRFENAGFDTESRTETGHPGETICRVAEEWDVDGIILGRRGLGTVREMLLGSVSRYVLHHATRPVLIVPRDSS